MRDILTNTVSLSILFLTFQLYFVFENASLTFCCELSNRPDAARNCEKNLSSLSCAYFNGQSWNKSNVSFEKYCSSSYCNKTLCKLITSGDCERNLQTFCTIDYKRVMLNKGNSSLQKSCSLNDCNVSFAFVKNNNCRRLRYRNADILTALHTKHHKESSSNITRMPIWPVFKGNSQLHDTQLRYYPTVSLGNSIFVNGSNTQDVKSIFGTENPLTTKEMENREKQFTTEKMQIIATNPFISSKKPFCLFLLNFKSFLSAFLKVFGLLCISFGCYSTIIHKKFTFKPLICLTVFSLFGIAVSFEMFLLCLAFVFGSPMLYNVISPLTNFLLALRRVLNSRVFGGKIKILCFDVLAGVVNVTLFHITSELPIEVAVFACISNFVVLAGHFLLHKRSVVHNSNDMSSRESKLKLVSCKRIQSLQISDCVKTFDQALNKRNDCISIVGISCRFAGGVNSKDAFWDLLVNGRCVIGSYPENRIEALALKRFYNPVRQVPGKHYTLKGAFLDEIAGFDAQFFGISPAECRAMDPQQRLLLQGVYEAIEDAGLRLEDLQKCRTGVYVGLMNLDYGRLLLDDGNVPNIDEFASTGITASTAANRISFSLNLNGPSLTVDTACSSSLTALNIAVTHLKVRECDVAIVCAPNLILARYFHTACCKTGLLAEDGRCKSFDATGDGYGRGEGIGVVVLKPTQIALLDNDEAYAKILACGLNNDGQTAIPMTAPSAKMQAELSRRVLQESGLQKTDIQYVETHGTGTAVGDVVEMRSVSQVYANASSRVLRIGSVKSNINHTESTAGLAGLIKVCLMIQNGYYVPTVNIEHLKPQLMIAERKMAVQTKLEPWSADDSKPRTAAVCSYGYGGANAHVIVQEVQSMESMVNSCQKRDCWVLTLSACSQEALRKMAEKFYSWLNKKQENDNLLKENICYTLNSRRSVLPHRLALTFRSFKQAANMLKLFSEDRPGWQKFVVVNDNSKLVKKIAFIYGGQGHCWHDMASELMQNEAKFRESIHQIDGVLTNLHIPWRLVDKLVTNDAEGCEIRENPIAQMALFGVHYAMTQLLKSWGIVPSAVVGHSLGEISAACTAHVISLEEAIQLILLRAGLHERCSGTGEMLAVGMPPEDAKKLLESLHITAKVSVAAVNSPTDVVLSGRAKYMQVIENFLQENHSNVFRKRLGTTRAFHSHEMDSIKNEFLEGIGRLGLRPGRKNSEMNSCVR